MNDQPEPDPEKVWELAITLMAGRNMSPSAAIRAVLQTRDLAHSNFSLSGDVVTPGDPPASFLPGKATDVWRSVTGEKPPNDWSTVPEKIETWCEDVKLRADLIPVVSNYLSGELEKNRGKNHVFNDEPVMRFIVDLLGTVHKKYQLQFGKHLRFFDLRSRGTTRITGIRLIGDLFEFGEPIQVGSDFVKLADDLSKAIRELREFIMGDHTEEDLPQISATDEGLEVIFPMGKTCPIEALLIEGEEILPGFGPVSSPAADS